jgi:hypothetical protein
VAEPDPYLRRPLSTPCNGGFGTHDLVVLKAPSPPSSFCQLTEKRAQAGSTMRSSAGKKSAGAMKTEPRRSNIC